MPDQDVQYPLGQVAVVASGGEPLGQHGSQDGAQVLVQPRVEWPAVRLEGVEVGQGRLLNSLLLAGGHQVDEPAAVVLGFPVAHGPGADERRDPRTPCGRAESC